MKKKILVEISASLLLLLFLFACLSHWLDFKTFSGNILNQPLPSWSKQLIIWGMPIVELLIAIGLLFDKTRLRSFQAAFFVLLSLSTYIILILANFFNRIPCSCSGLIPHLSWDQHLWFNVLFLVIALIGIVLKRGQFNHHGSAATQTMLR